MVLMSRTDEEIAGLVRRAAAEDGCARDEFLTCFRQRLKRMVRLRLNGNVESGGGRDDGILGPGGAAQGKSLALDLANIAFIGSTLLGKLIALDARLKSNGGRLELCHVNPEIREVFKVTRLDRLFVIQE
jgi:hypothetical protein